VPGGSFVFVILANVVAHRIICVRVDGSEVGRTMILCGKAKSRISKWDIFLIRAGDILGGWILL